MSKHTEDTNLITKLFYGFLFLLLASSILSLCHATNSDTLLKMNFQFLICLQQSADDLPMVQLMPLAPHHLLLH